MYRTVFGLTLLIGFTAPLSGIMPELKGADKSRITSIEETVKKASEQYSTSNFAECAKLIQQAQKDLESLVEQTGVEGRNAAEKVLSRMKRAAALLELEGIHVELNDLTEAVAKYDAKTSNPVKSGEPKPSPPSPPITGTSFSSDIAPVFLSRCGRCHISDSKGKFSLATYASLMKGPPEGVVVFPGDVASSRLIEVIETGAMPPNGNKIPAPELQKLKTWVSQGAKFDGRNPDALLATLTKGETATMNSLEGMAPKRATGSESVSFARQVAPLLVANCHGCHLEAQQARGGLRMDTLSQLLRGGDSGAVIDVGKGSTSLLVRKLRGQAGERMPAGGRPALSDSDIELISKWIDEGATIDEGTPEQNLRGLTARAWAKKASAEEISQRRKELAQKNWSLGNSNAAFRSFDSPSVLVVGDVGEGTLKLVAEAAESAKNELANLTKPAGRNEPLTGKTTIYVFPKRYGYSEFGQMIESRGLPSDWNGHWRYDGIDAYLAIVVSPDDSRKSIEPKLAGLLSSMAIAQLGEAPRWLAEGTGRMVTARLAGKNGPGPQWDSELLSTLGAVGKPEEFLDEKLPPNQLDLIGYGMARFLFDRNQRKGTDRMLRAIAEGKPFKEAVGAGFGVTPKELLAGYARWQATQKPKRP
jgi:mono/diheme cytochrome c family protein